MLPAMRCEDCETTWYSRVAHLIVEHDDLARCVKCGGRLVLDTEQAPDPALRPVRSGA